MHEREFQVYSLRKFEGAERETGSPAEVIVRRPKDNKRKSHEEKRSTRQPGNKGGMNDAEIRKGGWGRRKRGTNLVGRLRGEEKRRKGGARNSRTQWPRIEAGGLVSSETRKRRRRRERPASEKVNSPLKVLRRAI